MGAGDPALHRDVDPEEEVALGVAAGACLEEPLEELGPLGIGEIGELGLDRGALRVHGGAEASFGYIHRPLRAAGGKARRESRDGVRAKVTTDSLDHTSVPRTAVAADRSAWLLLVAAISGSAALILWFGRDTTFSFDELIWVVDSNDFSLRDAIEPYNGHLVLTSRLVYAGLVDVFGSDYLPYRVLAAVSVALLAALFFVYARARIGSLAALAPTLVLLVFGSDAVHVLAGNGFTVLLALACGVGALLALRRGDRAGEIAACALLCLGVVTYSVALPFVVGIAVMVLIRGDRWRRIWIAAIPATLYAAWWLWALRIETTSADETTLSNLLLLPAWSFQALGAVLAALTGLGYDFGDAPAEGVTGTAAALALLAIAAFAFRLRRGSVPAALWAATAVFIALSAMNLLVAEGVGRNPDEARYLFPAAIAVLLIAVEAVAGHRWRRGGLIALFAVALIGAAANIALLRDSATELRAGADIVRAELGAIELAGELAPADLDPVGIDPQTPLIFLYQSDAIDAPPNAAYSPPPGDMSRSGSARRSCALSRRRSERGPTRSSRESSGSR